MRRIFSTATALVSVGAVLSSQARDSTVLQPDQLFDRVAPSVWLVETFDANRKPVATGSSVVIGPGPSSSTSS